MCKPSGSSLTPFLARSYLRAFFMLNAIRLPSLFDLEGVMRLPPDSPDNLRKAKGFPHGHLAFLEDFHGAPQNGIASSMGALLSGTACKGSITRVLTFSTAAPGNVALAFDSSGNPCSRWPISSSV